VVSALYHGPFFCPVYPPTPRDAFSPPERSSPPPPKWGSNIELKKRSCAHSPPVTEAGQRDCSKFSSTLPRDTESAAREAISQCFSFLNQRFGILFKFPMAPLYAVCFFVPFHSRMARTSPACFCRTLLSVFPPIRFSRDCASNSFIDRRRRSKLTGCRFSPPRRSFLLSNLLITFLFFDDFFLFYLSPQIRHTRYFESPVLSPCAEAGGGTQRCRPFFSSPLFGTGAFRCAFLDEELFFQKAMSTVTGVCGRMGW